MSAKEYLGDSVYADFDGYAIILTTENGYPDDPRNRIVMEPSVFNALINYREGLKQVGQFKPGDFVAYTSGTGEKEIGRVKSVHPDPRKVFVVYKCGGNWDDFQNYTAAATDVRDLILAEKPA